MTRKERVHCGGFVSAFAASSGVLAGKFLEDVRASGARGVDANAAI